MQVTKLCVMVTQTHYHSRTNDIYMLCRQWPPLQDMPLMEHGAQLSELGVDLEYHGKREGVRQTAGKQDAWRNTKLRLSCQLTYRTHQHHTTCQTTGQPTVHLAVLRFSWLACLSTSYQWCNVVVITWRRCDPEMIRENHRKCEQGERA